MKYVRRAAALTAFLLTALIASAGSAIPIFVGIDSGASSIAPPGGPSAPLSGYLRIDVGSLPPNTETVTFDLLDVVADTDSLSIRLDPAFGNPGLGVLNTAGNFLIPNLHLVVSDSGAPPEPVTLTSILGTFDPGLTCSSAFCLDVQFAITTGAGPGETTVTVEAPEPGSLLLLAIGLGTGCATGRSRRASSSDHARA